LNHIKKKVRIKLRRTKLKKLKNRLDIYLTKAITNEEMM